MPIDKYCNIGVLPIIERYIFVKYSLVHSALDQIGMLGPEEKTIYPAPPRQSETVVSCRYDVVTHHNNNSHESWSVSCFVSGIVQVVYYTATVTPATLFKLRIFLCNLDEPFFATRRTMIDDFYVLLVAWSVGSSAQYSNLQLAT